MCRQAPVSLDPEGRLKMEDIGEILPCDNCGVPTYSRSNLPEDRPYAGLPEGITNGNARHKLLVGEPECGPKGRRVMTVCENCRYYVFGRW